jgi:Flp pilus assembly protein TadG
MTKRVARGRQRDERGIVIVYFAMTLVVLLLMSGFAVDLGGWYKRSQEIQRAADAAALAGVVYMPGDFATADAVARKTATANGFTDCACATGIHVSVAPDTESPRRLAVTIKDDRIPQYFTKVALNSVTEQRAAKAEYTQPIPMGSPENSLGTGPLTCGAPDNTCKNGPAGFWLAVDGFCTSKEDGDRYLAYYDSNRQGPPIGRVDCQLPNGVPTESPGNGEQHSSEYKKSGYFYDFDLPGTNNVTTANYKIEIYDASFVNGGLAGDGIANNTACPAGAVQPCPPNAPTVTTYWRLYKPDSTPLDHTDDVEVAPGISGAPCTPTDQSNPNDGCPAGVFASGDVAWQGWNALKTITAGSVSGTYRLQIFTKYAEADSYATNAFALRVDSNPTFKGCTTIGAGTCAMVHGEDAMSIFVNSPVAGGKADFYLAQINDSSDRGKVLTVSIFDAGDSGVTKIRLIDNKGKYLDTLNPSNTWATADAWPIQYSGTGCLCDLATTVTPLDANHSGTAKYSDRVVQFKYTIPAGQDITAQEGWWKLEYTASGSSVLDRTTWSVSLSGNPVHLVS